MMALNPQITKEYASGNIQNMHNLICRGAKYSFFLILFFLIPICLETNVILHLWLGNVPDYSVTFVRWTLVITSMGMLSNTLVTALHATGKIKKYMIIVGGVEILNFPLTYLCFLIKHNPIYAYYVCFTIYFILMFLRLYLIRPLINLNVKFYVREVYGRVFLVTVVALAVPSVICYVQTDSFFRFIEMCIICSLCTLLSVVYLGLSKGERAKVLYLINKRISKQHGKIL